MFSVDSPSCGSIPALPNYMEHVPDNCNMFQAHTFKCKEANHKLYRPEYPIERQYVDQETNLCLMDGAQWTHPDLSIIKCVKMCGNQPCAPREFSLEKFSFKLLHFFSFLNSWKIFSLKRNMNMEQIEEIRELVLLQRPS